MVEQPKMIRTPLLAEHVKRLKLDPHARFVSEQDAAIRAAEDHKQMIKAWRRAQEPVTLHSVPTSGKTSNS